MKLQLNISESLGMRPTSHLMLRPEEMQLTNDILSMICFWTSVSPLQKQWKVLLILSHNGTVCKWYVSTGIQLCSESRSGKSKSSTNLTEPSIELALSSVDCFQELRRWAAHGKRLKIKKSKWKYITASEVRVTQLPVHYCMPDRQAGCQTETGIHNGVDHDYQKLFAASNNCLLVP